MNLSPFVIAAAHELGVFGREGTVEEIARAMGVGEQKLRVLVEVLVAMGAMIERDGRVSAGVVPERVEVVRSGWGRLAEVIRTGRPVELEGTARAYHEHLVRAGAEAARELAAGMGDGPLIDLGGGAGAYTRAFLDGGAARRATLVDEEEVVAMAREVLAGFGERVTFVVGDARDIGEGTYGVAALVNVLHLHPPEVCRALCAAAVRAVRPGGRVIVKDVRVDDGRRGPIDGLMFALNMVVYTAGGDVYEVGAVKRWMEEAGLVDVAEHGLEAAPESVVLVGRKPDARGDGFGLAAEAGERERA